MMLWCVYTVYILCVQTVLYVATVLSMYTAVCTPQCLNGGNCTEPGVCNCTMEWMGNHCEQGLQLLTFIYLEIFIVIGMSK